MKKLIVAMLVVIGFQAYAQQDPLFSQYMFNKLAMNPAYAGSKEYFTGDILNRWQWVGIDGAPNTLSASVHSPLRDEHIGLGLYVYRDHLGPSVYQGAQAAFAYRIQFPQGKLSFGIQAGIKHSDIDWLAIDPYDGGDPLLTGQVKKKIIPDADFGIYYYSDKYFVGLSSKQLFQNQISIVKVDGKNEYTRLLRHFYGMAGAALPLTDGLVFRPSLLVKFVQNAPPQLDLNASFLFANTFWLGASYRTEKAISLLTEFYITRNLRIGYSYDIWLNELRAYNKGSHEIRLGFDMDMFHNRMLTPRYF